MPRLHRIGAWFLVFSLMALIFSPVVNGAAASYADRFNGSAVADNSKSGVISMLMDLIGNIINKLFHINISAGTNPTGDVVAKAGKNVLGFYVEWWDGDTSSYQTLKKNTDILYSIIPFWATVENDGSLKSRGGSNHDTVVNFARGHGINAVLMVNNAKHGTEGRAGIERVLANRQLREKVIDNLEQYIKNNNLNGVNIDFEEVSADSRNDLTTFMRELYGKLKPKGYTVSIDVFPKTDENNDVSVVYDYAELAKYADYIVIMTYDNHGAWSVPGPVAAIDWVEANVKYALRYIPKEKIYLGVAGYGYDWSAKGVESLEYKEAMLRAEKFSSEIIWDDESQSPQFFYIDVDGVKHEVWFENSFSSRFKIDLVNKYDLVGIALWKLGEEDPADWQLFRDKLK